MTRILVVDDNRDLAENIVEILTDAGFEADLYDDPCRALEDIVPGRYDLALLDLRMPGMDGVELYVALHRRDPRLLAIAMTAFAQDHRVRAAVDAGVLAVFPKPLDSALLLVRLGMAVGHAPALVIEDDQDLARNLAEALTDQGFQARHVGTCADARDVARETHPMVLLVDCRLPDGDGIALIEELCRSLEGTKAVAFSGHPRELADPRNRASARGVTFMEKPLDMPRLLSAVGAGRVAQDDIHEAVAHRRTW